MDNTAGCQLYLGKDALEASITTAKSSEINVLVPGAEPDGDWVCILSYLCSIFGSVWFCGSLLVDKNHNLILEKYFMLSKNLYHTSKYIILNKFNDINSSKLHLKPPFTISVLRFFP